MTLPGWLRHPREATLEPAPALGLALAWWVFWVLDLQAWQGWFGGALPAWGWLALSAVYGALAIAGRPRFIGGPAMLCGLSGACTQTLAINHLAAGDWLGVPVSATMMAACMLVMAFGDRIADAPAMAQREVWMLALCLGQACAVLTVVVAWAVSGLCC